MVLRVKPTPTWFPTNSLYTPMDNTPLHSISSVCHPWGGSCRCRHKSEYHKMSLDEPVPIDLEKDSTPLDGLCNPLSLPRTTTNGSFARLDLQKLKYWLYGTRQNVFRGPSPPVKSLAINPENFTNSIHNGGFTHRYYKDCIQLLGIMPHCLNRSRFNSWHLLWTG